MGQTSAPAGGDDDEEVVWSDAQKAEMNMHLAKARLRFRRTQLKAQRGGQGRHELRKQKLEMKSSTPQPPILPPKAYDELQTHELPNPDTPFSKSARRQPSGLSGGLVPPADAAPPGAKNARGRRARKAAAKKKAQQEAEKLEAGKPISLPGGTVNGVDYDAINIHLTDGQVAKGPDASVETVQIN